MELYSDFIDQLRSAKDPMDPQRRHPLRQQPRLLRWRLTYGSPQHQCTLPAHRRRV
jgi:hypothetical protein